MGSSRRTHTRVGRAQIARLTKLESLSLNCGHPRDGFKDGGDGIIQLVKGLPHLTLLRVQPFTAFGSFLGDWHFVADCKARRLPPRAIASLLCHQEKPSRQRRRTDVEAVVPRRALRCRR